MLRQECAKILLIKHHRPLKQIQQLAYIPRIVILHKRGYLLLRKMALVVLEPPTVCYIANILLVFLQRRHPQLNHVKALIEIGAEFSFTNKLGQISVSRRHKPYIRLDFLATAHAHETPALENPQKRPLGLKRQLANLIQKERAAVRKLE